MAGSLCGEWMLPMVPGQGGNVRTHADRNRSFSAIKAGNVRGVRLALVLLFDKYEGFLHQIGL
jgi:hypothetical protein